MDSSSFGYSSEELTLEKKISGFLNLTLRAYNVPREEAEKAIAVQQRYGGAVDENQLAAFLAGPQQAGAFRCDNSVFREMARRQLRTMERTGEKARLLMVELQNRELPGEKRAQLMRRMELTSLESLRMGDPFTRMGADCILLDVKTGSGAFMKTEQEAVQLGEAMVRTAKLAGKRCRAVVTDMDMPLGSAVGNAIEVAEAISVLQGQRHTALGKLSLAVAAHMLTMCGRGTLEQCLAAAEQAVDSGTALERFAWMLQCQGGDPAVAEHPERLPQPANSLTVTADRAGYLTRIASEEIGLAAMELGAGRRKAEDVLDPTAGLKLHCAVGDPVTPGMPLATLYATGVTDFSAAAVRVRGAMPIGEAQPRVQPLLRQVIDTEGTAG